MSAVLVVARYTENLDWLRQVHIPKVIYNKGPYLPNCVVATNVGREAHTYLSFIVDHYDHLPEKVFFTQGDPFPHSPHFLHKLEDALQRPFEFIALGDIDTELITASKSHPGIEKALHDMSYELLGYSPRTLFFPVGALFGYSREFIQKRPLSFWQSMLQKCVESYDQPNCQHEHCHRQQPCGCQNPYSPWCFERLWFYL
jgi:hypothetical protein